MSKPKGKRSRHQETSSDSEREEGSEDAYEDLNSPYKRPKPTPFTQRITCFKYHRRAKLPQNIRVYEGNKDPEDHLGIFFMAAKQEEWLMPVWCKMFRQTLGGAARKWFDDLDPKSVDSFKELKDRGHNTNECYQLKKQIEEVVASGKLAHLVKDIRQNNQRNGNQGRNGVKIINMIREGGNRKRPFKEGRSGLTDELTFLAIPRYQSKDEPIILEGIIEGQNSEDAELRWRVYYVEGLGHNLFSVGQFCDSNLEVAFRQHTYFIRNLEGVDLLTGSRGNNLYTLSLGDMMASSPICLLSKASKTKISHETYVARSLQQNGVVERRNRTLIEAAHTMLVYAKAPLFLWAEAVATACYTKNRSIVRLRHGKTPYELLHDKPPDLSFFHVFGALCYSTNDSDNLGKLQSKDDIDFDELTAMAFEHSSSGPALHEMTPVTISSGLMPNPPPSTPFVPPLRND
ncbi:retrovirus-related pol polyprotein from transposon TNT 1-94 [Tanacetum coccineum]